MPIVTITLQAGRPAQQIQQLMDVVHEALVTSLGLGPQNRNQRLIEIQPEHYHFPVGRSQNFMTVEIASFPGRSEASKRTMFQQITHNLQQTLQIDPNDVMILIHEPPLENWCVNGRQASERKRP